MLCSACSGNSPTAPAPSPTPTPTATITGHVSATNGGQALAGLSVDLGAPPTTTDASGTFRSTVTPTASMRAILSGSGIVPRTVFLAAGASRDVAVDAIALGGGFDPTFYREIARNGFDAPNFAEPLRRWTQNPSVYIQQAAGIDARTVDMVEATIRAAVPLWTAGTLSVATIERGVEVRQAQSYWLTVRWSAENTGHCGVALVGVELGGFVELQPATPGCTCNGYQARPGTVTHEIGHAMGFYHTDNPNDAMFIVSNQCEKTITARELYHAAIAYRRPVGNSDPDTDPASAVNLSPMRVY